MHLYYLIILVFATIGSLAAGTLAGVMILGGRINIRFGNDKKGDNQ